MESKITTSAGLPSQPDPPARLSYADPADPFWKRLLIRSIEFLLGRPGLEARYEKVRRLPVPDHLLWKESLAALNITSVRTGFKLDCLERNGPLVLIANHPFGVVDGLLLCELAAEISPEFRVLINAVLTGEARVNQFFIPIDFAETPVALETNMESRKQSLELLDAGGVLLLFPSGGVATAKPFWKKAEDLPWKPFVMKLISRSRATVLPVFVEGQNSRWFHLASAIHLNLRLALLLHETRNKIGRTFRITIGKPVTATEIEAISRQQRLDWLKARVDELGSRRSD